MEDRKESTKARSKAVTSATKASRQPLSVPQSTQDGSKLPTEERAEKIRETLARLMDVTNSWPCKIEGKMPVPFISNDYIVFAFPKGGHVIKNLVTSEGKQNFSVDDVTVLPSPVDG